MVKIVYNMIIIPVLYITLNIAAVFSSKLRKSVNVRKDVLKKIEKERTKLNPYRTTVLFHCSSMGEYKQILPVIKKLGECKKQEYNIVLSLYSPSAYEHIDRNNPSFSLITYTPFDFYFETKKFINAINPDIVLISKHDVWPNFIWELKKREVAVYLINGLFADDTKMNKWYAKFFFRTLFSDLTGILTVNETHRQRFLDIFPYPEKITVSGDTRYDAVIYEAGTPMGINHFEQLKGNDRVLIAGSSWPAGEKHILNAWKNLKQKYKTALLIIIPHEIGADHIYKLESICQEKELSSISFTNMTGKEKLSEFDVVIIDKIGLLTKLYRYGSIAYVGGGFSKNGLHSVLEPAVYGLPVVFGPNLDKSPEAQEMNRLSCGMIFNDDKELYNIIDSLWSDNKLYSKVAEISSGYIGDNSGASDKIAGIITAITQKPKINKRTSLTEQEFDKLISGGTGGPDDKRS
ncbi:MAG TPA: glycosyltransferase N-terminal domain-containing protein [Clostridiales bacterium]|jgi:3-deoxy-D-manno-octulosonic-acid transferase|nr:glycosyltransferase N-terminal domain-containing protein [Clostridiales bacterium]HQP69426.1 glycosyltransferase N-terminal domain-containing protein [Clostridiales bacterium]